MGRLRELASRIWGTFRGARMSRELDEELRTHFQLLVDDNVRRGMNPREAHRQARIQLGGHDQTREAYRDQRGLPFVDSLVQDARYGFRIMRKNPGFTLVATVTLALGIGANTAIFSVVNAVMIASMPVYRPHELLLLNWAAKEYPSAVDDIEGNLTDDPLHGGLKSESFSYAAFDALRESSRSYAELFAFASNILDLNAQVRGRAYSVRGEGVSGNYFSGLGVRPILGRPITWSDDSSAANPVAIISYGFWRDKLGSDESVLGSTLVTNSIEMTIVGVAPPEFYGTQPGQQIEVWVPIGHYGQLLQALIGATPGQSGSEASRAAVEYWRNSKTWWLVLMGRLKPGVREQQAEAESRVIFDQTLEAAGAGSANDRPKLFTAPGDKGMDGLRRRFSQPLLVLMCAVGLVLLIACANVAGLMLARAAGRQREIAVRLSLGARRIRLIQQLLTESVMLSAAGGVLGLIVANWLSNLLVKLASDRWDVAGSVGIDGRVLAFTSAVALLTGLLFGLAPALKATRANLGTALKEGVAAGRSGGRRSWLAKMLVSAQVALSLVLLIGAGLFMRTLFNLETVPLGFERQNLITFSVSPGLNGYKGVRLAQYYRDVNRRIAATPGVRSVSFSSHGPVGSGESSSIVTIPGLTNGEEKLQVHRHLIGPAYFETLGIPLLTGRTFGERDDASAPKITVINEALVRAAFAGENPLGKVLRFGTAQKPRDFEIAGVVGDAKYNNLRNDPPPTAYFSHLQALDSASLMTFQVRTTGDSGSVVAAIRGAVAEVDKNVPVNRLETLVATIDRALIFERMFSRLTGVFGLLALVLVCVGLYGTMSYFVARRTNEIGVRVALGARPARVFRMILLEGLRLTLVGIAAGLAGAAAGTRLIASELFAVPQLDPLTFSACAAVLLLVGSLACYVPARRAMKVDPMVALRCE